MRHPRQHHHHPAPAPETALEEFTEAETGHAPHALEVVDVRVVDPVQTVEHPARTLIAYRVAVAGLAVQLAPELRTRARLTINATGADVFLANSRSVTTGTGYRLAAGQVLTLDVTDHVFAIATDATPADVSVLAEVREG
jgi:hypothetical protein